MMIVGSDGHLSRQICCNSSPCIRGIRTSAIRQPAEFSELDSSDSSADSNATNFNPAVLKSLVSDCRIDASSSTSATKNCSVAIVGLSGLAGSIYTGPSARVEPFESWRGALQGMVSRIVCPPIGPWSHKDNSDGNSG